MSESELILRIAAKGDGVTASGRHATGAVTGDTLLADGTLIAGPHHVEAACRHYGVCGGCQLQHADEETLAEFVKSRIGNLTKDLLDTPEQLKDAYLSPAFTRRRAVFHGGMIGGRIVIGYREGGSHKTVDLAECPVVLPEFAAFLPVLKKFLNRQAPKKGKSNLSVEITLASVDQGLDVGIKGLTIEGLAATEAVLDFARENGLARFVLDQGYGPESLWEPEPVTLTLSGVPVSYPAGAFVQATRDGEQVLVDAVREWLAGSAFVADLFSGLGTFAFALAGQRNGVLTKVLAVEAARDTHMACKVAAGVAQRPIAAMHRDLFRNPLQVEELNRFSAVLLDPPRAGARDQVSYVAQSTVEKVVYISCNPMSWSRDAVTLIEAGYRLAEVRPVGQFRWSTHVELASYFVRESAENS